MNRFAFPFLVTFAVLFLAQTLQAKTFKSEFIKFELPANWDCNKEEIDWLCQPDDIARRSDAILVVVTKVKNEVDDSFAKYREVLSASRDMRDLVGNPYKSVVKYVREKDIKGLPWIDSLHFGSEIPGFYTRYVASIKDKVAGLVTYSIAESVYAEYAPVLDAMVNSLEMQFDPKAFDKLMNAGPLFGSQSRQRLDRGAPRVESDNVADKEEDGESFDMGQIAGLLLMLGAIGFYIYKKKNG